MDDIIGILLLPLLHVVASICAIGTVFVAFKLYSETDKAWYWLSMLLSAVLFAVSQCIFVLAPFVREFVVIGIIRESLEIGAVLLFAISCYGIYTGMKEIRKMVG